MERLEAERLDAVFLCADVRVRCPVEICVSFLGDRSDDLDDLGMQLFSSDEDAALLDDPGFPTGDLTGGVPEEALMVEIDRGEDAGEDEMGREDVGRVQLSTHPAFHDDHVQLALPLLGILPTIALEDPESSDGEQFEQACSGGVLLIDALDVGADGVVA